MKKSYISFLVILYAIMGCRDESKNPIPTSQFKDGVTFEATAKSSAFLDVSKVNEAKMEFDTKTTRPDLIAKMDIMAELIPVGGEKVTKFLTTIPQLVGTTSIPYSQFLTALGISASQLKPGDIIRAKFVATTPDGRIFSEDNTVGTLPAKGSSGFTRSINVTVACVFSAAQFATGTWVVDIDDWQDYKKGDEIKVTAGPGANDLTLGIFATNGKHKDIVVNITNTNTGAATVAKQEYGTYGNDPAVWSAQGIGNVSGCAGTIELVINHTSIEYGAFPGNKLKLTRK